MELCVTQPFTILHSQHHRLSSSNLIRACHRLNSSLPLKQNLAPGATLGPSSRLFYLTNHLTRATTSEETSSGSNQYVGEDRDTVITLEDVPASSSEKKVYNENMPEEASKEESAEDDSSSINGLPQAFEFLDNLNVKFDSENAYNILLYGSGGLVALWLTSAIVGAVDSIPLFPKLMEVVGLGYTLWFSWRYLIFKRNRDELVSKIEELKQQVLGANDN